MNESFLSKIKPRNFVCSTTGIGVPLSSNCGSGCALRRREKCTQTVLVGENLKPLESYCRYDVVHTKQTLCGPLGLKMVLLIPDITALVGLIKSVLNS